MNVFFRSFFSVGNPAFVSRSSDGRPLRRCHCLWEFHALCFCQITLRCSARSNISSPLFTFFFPCSHILTPRPTLTTSAVVSRGLSYLKEVFHLQALRGVIIFRIQTDKTCSFKSSVNSWNSSSSTNVWWPSEWSKINFKKETALQ